MKQFIIDGTTLFLTLLVDNHEVDDIPDNVCPEQNNWQFSVDNYVSYNIYRHYNLCRCGNLYYQQKCCGVCGRNSEYSSLPHKREASESTLKSNARIDGEKIITSFAYCHTSWMSTPSGRACNIKIFFEHLDAADKRPLDWRGHPVFINSLDIAEKIIDTNSYGWSRFIKIAESLNRIADANVVREMAFRKDVSVEDAVRCIVFHGLNNHLTADQKTRDVKSINSDWQVEAIKAGLPKDLLDLIPIISIEDYYIPTMYNGYSEQRKNMVYYLVSHSMTTLQKIERLLSSLNGEDDEILIPFVMKNIVRYGNFNPIEFEKRYRAEQTIGPLKVQNVSQFLSLYCKRSAKARGDHERLTELAETNPVEYLKAVAEYAPALKR